MEIFHAHPLGIIISIAAAGAALAYYFSWKRGKDVEQLAVSAGLPYSAAGPDVNVLEAAGLGIFRLGHSRKAANLVKTQARSGVISFFDYRYVTSGGKNSHVHNFTLALVECSGSPVPCFELKPESFIYKIGEAVGFKDIDLPAFPLFSDKYRLTGPDEAAVRLFFTPQRAAWFERNLGLRVQGAPGYIVISKRDGYLPVNAWGGFMEDVKAFAAEALL